MPGYLTIGNAAKQIGISARTLRERIRAGELTTYTNPVDKRTKLVAVEDLDRFTLPTPIVNRRQEAPSRVAS